MLPEYHKFIYKNKYYLFNVDDMKAYRITEYLYEEIDKINIENENKIDGKLNEALINMGLYYKEGKKDKQSALPQISPVKTIALNIAQKCNMNCIYCYGNEGEYNGSGLMKTATAFTAVDWLINNSGKVNKLGIIFFGGEPLLNYKLLKKVIQYANLNAAKNNKNISFSITTNGTLLDSEKIKFINENNISVVISWDGDIEIQKQNRPMKKSMKKYSEYEKNIREFLQTRGEKQNTSVRVTVTKNNWDLIRVNEYLTDLGFKTIHWAEAVPPIGKKEECGYSLNEEQRESILTYIEKLEERTLDSIRNGNKYSDRYLISFIKQLYEKRHRNYYCGVGRGMVGIGKDGNVYPCHRFIGMEEVLIGTINNRLDDEKRMRFNNYGNTHPQCIKCWARHFCGGGCLYENMQGTINNEPEPYENRCKIIKRSVEMSIVVYDGLNKSERAKLGIIDEALEQTHELN